MRIHTGLAGLLLATWGAAPTAWAAPLPPELQACLREQDDHRRLACYDQQMAKLATEPSASFGLSPEQERKSEAAATHEKPTTPVLSTTVSTAVVRADGRQLIRLTNGQTWVQGEAYDVVQVRPGDTVTIKPGLLGSFYLYTPSGKSTRVTRSQ